MKRAQCPQSEAGVTLIELMIAVAIVAVLATIGVVGYSKYIKNARVVAAREMIGRIQMAEEAYFERTGQYCSATGTGTTPSWHPALSTGFSAMDWGTPPTEWTTCFGSRLTPEGNTTYFSYQVFAGTSTTAGAAATLNITATAPWYYVLARADMDGNGAPYTELRVTSQRRKIWTINEGQ